MVYVCMDVVSVGILCIYFLPNCRLIEISFLKYVSGIICKKCKLLAILIFLVLQ